MLPHIMRRGREGRGQGYRWKEDVGHMLARRIESRTEDRQAGSHTDTVPLTILLLSTSS